MNLRQQDHRAAGTIAAGAAATWAGPGAAPLPVLPITIGAGQAIAHRGWVAAREAALAALRSGPSLVAIAGAPGTGKTLLLEELARVLTASGAAITLHRRGDLGQDAAAGAGDAQAAFRVVLIDEADRMDETALARLAADARSGLVLACKQLPADGEADPRCAAASGGRPVSFVRLAPLLPGETGAFLRERLARTGHPGGVIGDDAIAALEAYSGRVPRLVNMLASAALFLAASNDERQVSAEHVAEAAALRSLAAPGEPQEPATSDAPAPAPAAPESEPASGGAAGMSGAPATEIAVIPPGLPEQPKVGSEPTPSAVQVYPPGGPGLPDRVSPILPAADAARVLIARNAAAVVRPPPGPASADRPRAFRRVAVLALCTVAGGAAAAGWIASHEANPTSQSARGGTAPLLPTTSAGGAGARAPAGSDAAPAATAPARLATSIPAAADPRPIRNKLAATSAPLTSPPPAVASSSAQPNPATPAPSSPPAAAAEATRGQGPAPNGPRPPPPTATLAARQPNPSAGAGTSPDLPSPAERHPVAPSAVASAKPPPAPVANPIPTAADLRPIRNKLAAASAPFTPPPPAAHALPSPSAVASNSAQPNPATPAPSSPPAAAAEAARGQGPAPTGPRPPLPLATLAARQPSPSAGAGTSLRAAATGRTAPGCPIRRRLHKTAPGPGREPHRDRRRATAKPRQSQPSPAKPGQAKPG